MKDWLEELDDEQRAEWETFVKHAREETLRAMDDSAFVMSLIPHEPDVKFAVELGFAIMLDKPILAVAMPGADVPPKLRLVADEVIEADVDVEAGRQRVAQAIERFGEEIS